MIFSLGRCSRHWIASRSRIICIRKISCQELFLVSTFCCAKWRARSQWLSFAGRGISISTFNGTPSHCEDVPPSDPGQSIGPRKAHWSNPIYKLERGASEAIPRQRDRSLYFILPRPMVITVCFTLSPHIFEPFRPHPIDQTDSSLPILHDSWRAYRLWSSWRRYAPIVRS